MGARKQREVSIKFKTNIWRAQRQFKPESRPLDHGSVAEWSGATTPCVCISLST